MVRKFPEGEATLFGPSKATPGETDPAEVLLRSFVRMTDLKGLYRQGWLKRGVSASRAESVGDHCFGTALLVLLTAGRPPFEDVDREKCLRMALIHEWGEVYAGDITPVDGVSKEEKYRREKEAFLAVTAGLPDSAELFALWDEFEAGESPEAQLLRRLDRLELGIQAALLKAEGFKGMDEFLDSARGSVGKGFLGALLQRAEKSGGPS